jgi:hypothetical protein
MAPRHKVDARPVRTRARAADAQPAPTSEQVKALADQLDWSGQKNLLYLFLADKESVLGKTILAYLNILQVNVVRLERLAGRAPEDTDPLHVLGKSVKQAMKATGMSADAVRQERCRARKRQKKGMTPPFSASTD